MLRFYISIFVHVLSFVVKIVLFLVCGKRSHKSLDDQGKKKFLCKCVE